jgi:hypothetical protein
MQVELLRRGGSTVRNLDISTSYEDERVKLFPPHLEVLHAGWRRLAHGERRLTGNAPPLPEDRTTGRDVPAMDAGHRLMAKPQTSDSVQAVRSEVWAH